MNLLDYIKKIPSVFNKDDVEKSCDDIIKVLNEVSIPAYAQSVELFKNTKFKSDTVNKYENIFTKAVIIKEVKENKLLTKIQYILENLVQLLESIKELSKHDFSNTESNLSLTYKKSTHLRVIQVSEFINIYSRKLLNYIYILETNEVTKEDEKLVKADLKYIEDNFGEFMLLCKSLSLKKELYNSLVKDIPEAVISEITESTLPSSVGNHKLDPLMMKGLLSGVSVKVLLFPIYYGGLAIANYQASKYKSAKAELELLQLRKLNLERINNNEPDVRLQKEIDYHQKRINNLEYSIHQMEEDYDL